MVRGGGVNEAELRALEETQLAQLEHLIAQQRKAHQRMRHVLREAEKVREPLQEWYVVCPAAAVFYQLCGGRICER